MHDNIVIGKITSTHGVRGHIKLESYTNPMDKIFTLPLCLEYGQTIKLKIIKKDSRPIICSIIDPQIIDKTTAENYRNTLIYTSKSNLPKIESEDEFYVIELVGIDVCTTLKQKIGKVLAVHNFGAGDIIEIRFLDKKTEMYPFNKEFFPIIEKTYLILDL